MPFVQPGINDVHIDGPLSNISIAQTQDETAFVAGRAFQTIPSNKPSNKYFIYDRGDLARDEMKERATDTESEGATSKRTTATYTTKHFGLHTTVPDEIRNAEDDPLDANRDASIFLTQKGLLNREIRWKNKYFLGTPWATTQSVTTKWDVGTSTPIEDVRAAIRTVNVTGGKRANVGVLSREVFDTLLDHPDIVGRVDRGQTQGTAQVMKDTVASLFELDEILVMDAIQNTAKEGATDAFSFISGAEGMLLVYRPPSPGIMTPAAGYTFVWNGFGDFGSATGMTISSFRKPGIRSDFFEIDSFYDQKVVTAGLGLFFDDVLT